MSLKSLLSNNHLFIILALLAGTPALTTAQDSLKLKPGDLSPSFIMRREANTIQSITWPYMKKIVLLYFWSSDHPGLSRHNRRIGRIAARYRFASYKNAEGFEVIAIAAQGDRKTWLEAIQNDSLDMFTHGIALKGLNDDICKKFGVDSLPYSVLVDEEGRVLSLNPRLLELEDLLDERRNFQSQRKEIVGRLALSTNKSEVLPFGKVYLFSVYGDSLAKCLTSAAGIFRFENVKLGQDFILKVDNKTDINTSDPIALYTVQQEYLMDGRTRDEGFIFHLAPRMNGRLAKRDSLANPPEALGEIDITKSLSFAADGASLTARDEQDLAPILQRLKKNNSFHLELITHTDSRLEAAAALELSARQANALKTYFEMKGISGNRIKAVAKGNSEPRKLCGELADCREDEYRLNRRVEFLVYKD